MTMEDNTSGHHHHHHHGGHRRTPNTPRDHDIQVPVNIIKTEREVCCSCGMLIQDRYLLKVNGSSWHAACLRCCVCQTLLERQPSCFVRGERVYCRADYIRQFGAKCAKCSRTIHASDWVRRAREQVYHLACFACDACKRQLSTGEEFALHENRVLCKAHYLESLDAAAGSGSNDDGGRRGPTESQDQEGSNHFHGGATASFASQLQPGFEPGWPGLGTDRPNNRTQQTGYASLVPEFPRQTEEVPQQPSQESSRGRSKRGWRREPVSRMRRSATVLPVSSIQRSHDHEPSGVTGSQGQMGEVNYDDYYDPNNIPTPSTSSLDL